MFDVSWGELVVLAGVGFFFVGRQDLPRVARMAGTYTGRLVGFLQGARARADQYAAQSELRQLQNELRAGLRELDAVKSELAVSMSASRGLVGRTLGPTVPGANKIATGGAIPFAPQINPPLILSSVTPETIAAAGPVVPPLTQPPTPTVRRDLASKSQSVAAVAEEEWLKQGIGYKSRAEMGSGMRSNAEISTSGSTVLAKIIQESLVYDQYDRAMQEQDDILQSKMSQVMQKMEDKKKK